MIYAVLAVLGLCMGSFITALTWRLHEKKDFVKARSVCESCKETLNASELVPVLSFVLQGGKCKHCGKKISWLNPALEVGMALLFVGMYVWWPLELSDTGSYIQLVSWYVFAVGLVALFVYDIKWLLIPNSIIYPMIVAAIAVQATLAIFFDGGTELVKDTVFGLLIGGGFFYSLFIVSKGRWIGGGDVKLGMFIGISLGALKAGLALIISFYTAALVVLPLLALKIVKRKTPIPFGPFLIAATFVALLFGQQIFDWYDSYFLNELFK